MLRVMGKDEHLYGLLKGYITLTGFFISTYTIDEPHNYQYVSNNIRTSWHKIHEEFKNQRLDGDCR